MTKTELKQETPEEAAERLFPTTIDSFTDNGFDLSERERLIFIKGAKWQQERMYSEEDLQEAFYSRNNNWIDFEQWFEQFKKK
jgi:hypothetical protein